MSSYQCLIEASLPKQIAVADKPLRLGGKIEYLPLNEFQKRLGITYNESILIDPRTKIVPFKENIQGYTPAPQLKKQVEKILKAAYEGLVICKMGEFGHGVFTSKDIPKDTVVAIYAGTIISGSGTKVSYNDESLGYFGSNIHFSTKNHRGIASFMQHLPEEPKLQDPQVLSSLLKMSGQVVSVTSIKLETELYSTVFCPSKTKELISTANIRQEFLNFNNIPLIALVTERVISAGDLLGFPYGYYYWYSRNITPEYFDKSGNALSWTLYKKTFGQLNFGTFSYTGEYAPLIDSLNKNSVSIKILGDDKKMHDVAGNTLLILLLKANAAYLYVDLN